MRKRGWILALALSLSFGLMAQTEEASTPAFKKHQIQLLLGNSFAAGNFAKTDSRQEESGFAKNGFFFGLTYHYQFSEYVAATFAYQGSNIKFDGQAFLDEVSVDNNLVYELVYEDYINASALVGVKLMAGSKVQFFFNPTFGYAEVITPELWTTLLNGNQGASVTQKEATGGGFAFAVGTGVQFKAGELVTISLNYQFLTAVAEIETDVESIDFNGVFSTTKDTYDQPISTSTISAGLGFNF